MPPTCNPVVFTDALILFPALKSIWSSVLAVIEVSLSASRIISLPCTSRVPAIAVFPLDAFTVNLFVLTSKLPTLLTVLLKVVAPLTASPVKVPTLVILGCATVVNVPTMFPLTVKLPAIVGLFSILAPGSVTAPVVNLGVSTVLSAGVVTAPISPRASI